LRNRRDRRRACGTVTIATVGRSFVPYPNGNLTAG
jgi:hypothetical protein